MHQRETQQLNNSIGRLQKYLFRQGDKAHPRVLLQISSLYKPMTWRPDVLRLDSNREHATSRLGQTLWPV